MVDVLAEERRRQIVERVRRLGTVRVATIAIEFAVAEETVRRDLKLLDEQGVLTRTHGGAVSRQKSETPGGIDVPFELRRQVRRPQKRAIAREALRRITGPMTIALDGSSTAWELASLLETPGLTVVTNSLIITTLLAASPMGTSVICAGGSLDRSLMIFTGLIALDALKHTHIDLFFCSCAGVSATRGFSDPSESGAHFKRRLIDLADRTVLLVDSSKFAERTPVLFASPGEVSELITDDAVTADTLAAFHAAGLRTTVVSPDSVGA